MANDLVRKQDASIKAYRSIFVARATSALGMTLHELVDEFKALTEKISTDTTINEEGRKEYGETALLSFRERNIFSSIANARFGISLADSYNDTPDDF